MKCPRCQNEDKNYFYLKNGQVYCRKCISFSNNIEKLKPIKINKKIDYQLDYALTAQQEKASNALIKRYQNKQNTTLKAVCGAGKTEMIYGVVKYALNRGDRVCLTMPRKELVIELAKRIEEQFINIKPIVVYGGHHETIDGQFIICTTHQLYRYPNCFDLLILDEFDAFPYRGNEVLENLLKNSIKGNYIFMSATIDDGDVQVIERFHHQDIPVPRCIVVGVIQMYIMLIIRLKRYQKEKKPVFLFVSSIDQTTVLYRYLKLFKIRSYPTSSKTKEIHKQIERLKNHELDVIVTTTVLERGITVKNIQVIIINGEHRLFDKETLIQIAGRVGRKLPYPNGDVIIYASKKTEAIKACIKSIKQDNALFAINH